MNNRSRYLATLLMVFVSSFAGCQADDSLVLTSTQRGGAPATPAHAVAERTRVAAVGLLGALTDAQQAKAVRPIDDQLRQDWHFIPRQRQGVTLGELDTAQKTRVHELLQTALSDAGYLKATGIIWLETVLYEISNQNPMRDPGKYALLIFGDPADPEAAWGWRLEGHHLSINLTYTAEGIGVTPLFFGANPAVVPQGPLAGTRILSDAHDLAVQLAQSMSDEQRAKMVLAEKPRDVITGPGREQALRDDTLGISSSDLSKEQQLALLTLAGSHWDALDHNHRFEFVDRVLTGANYPDLFRFAWAGPISADETFYYRISSRNAKFVIEYSCQGRNHVHCVMHELNDPLQQDLLRQHFEQHHHHDE